MKQDEPASRSGSALPCPLCGHAVDLSDNDTLYPNGTGWRQELNLRTYHGFREVPKEQWCWSMHCPTTAGGCGMEVSGDSRDEALAAWNQRAPRSELGKPDPLAQWKGKPSAEEIEAHYPGSQHQPDECEMCRFIHDAAKAYVSSERNRSQK